MTVPNGKIPIAVTGGSLRLHARGRVQPHPSSLFDDQRGDRVDMRGGDSGDAGEFLHCGKDAVDVGRAGGFEILQHRGFVRHTRHNRP